MVLIVGSLVVVLLGVFLILPIAVELFLNSTAAQPPYKAAERARALHRTLRVADLHADSLLWSRDLLLRGTRGHVDVPRLIEGNVALQAFTIVTQSPRWLNMETNSGDTDDILPLAVVQRWPKATWTSLAARALHQAEKLQDTARRSEGRFTLIRSAAELAAYLERRSREPGITAGFLGVEGAHALDGDLGRIDAFFEAGIRMMAPTHFFDNDIGGSAHGLKKGGLTDKGREMVRRMEAKKMLVDLAHASPGTFDDAVAMSTRPVVVSHTGVRGTFDSVRNLSDGQLKAVAGTGGLVGIGYWAGAVGETDVRAIARAIRYTVKVIGAEHVALGSDFDGAVKAPFDTSGLVVVTDALLQEGLSESDIAKIMGENTLRVLLAALP